MPYKNVRSAHRRDVLYTDIVMSLNENKLISIKALYFGKREIANCDELTIRTTAKATTNLNWPLYNY